MIPAALLAAIILLACGDDGPTNPPHELGSTTRVFSTGNVRIMIDNRGIIGQDPVVTRGFGFFPANTSHNYVFGSGLWVGGVLNGVEVVFTAYDERGGFSESKPGRFASTDNSGGRILCSSDEAEVSRWYPEFTDPSSGRPLVIGDEDCVVIYNDGNPGLSVRDPIGLEVRQRVAGFHSGILSQAVLVVWDILNAGPAPLEEAYAAVTADFDIGEDFADDRCSAILTGLLGQEVDLGFCWDSDFDEQDFKTDEPAFVGVTLLRSPAGPSVSPALTRFTLTGLIPGQRPPPDPGSDEGQYNALSGIRVDNARIDTIPADQRFLAISGPFRLAAGEVRRFVAAYVWAQASVKVDSLHVDSTRCFPQGRPCFLADPTDPPLEELLQVRQAVEDLVDVRVPLSP
jgi:hypothetical protein